MPEIKWDLTGERTYETGVDHGVLYLPDEDGAYSTGVPWNGLVTVTESPTGGEPTPQYADNIKYLNILSQEEFGATIEAFTYPEEFELCDGTAIVNGVRIGQQRRRIFGFSWRSLIGNDVDQTDYGYKLHLVYGALASPSDRTHNTVNETPEANTFSWDVTTTKVEVGTVGGVKFAPTSHLIIPSTEVDSDDLEAFEAILYGAAETEPMMPLPADVLAAFPSAAGG